MPERSQALDRDVRDTIVDVVLETIQTDGSDAVRVVDVARRARVSLTTVYKSFASRDELILAAIDRWMDTLVYREFTPPRPEESLYELLMRGLRTVFEPWERQPNMLRAFHRARTRPGGERLEMHAIATIGEPLARALLERAEPGFVRDVGMILSNVRYALIARFTDDRIAITDILPAMERAVFWLAAANPSIDAAGRPNVSNR